VSKQACHKVEWKVWHKVCSGVREWVVYQVWDRVVYLTLND
jgi:hypothetical protein